MKTRKSNALLAPLAPVIDGTVTDGRLTGSYRDFRIQAEPRSGYPVMYTRPDNATDPARVKTLQITLLGVPGSQTWHCQSSPSSPLQGAASWLTSGRLLKHFKPGEFTFEGADTISDAMQRMGEKLTNRLGLPLKANADPALQDRLLAAGLFAELDALRLGPHPYLPKLGFVPGAREMTSQLGLFARMQPQLEERLRAAGVPDPQALLDAKLQEAGERSPGRLTLEVEVGKDGTLSPAEFQMVLDRLVRIAEINAEINAEVTAGVNPRVEAP